MVNGVHDVNGATLCNVLVDKKKKKKKEEN